MRARLTVLASLTHAVAEAAAPDPASRAALLRGAGLEGAEGAAIADPADPEARVPRDVDRLVWRAAAMLAGPGFGLRLAEGDALKGAFGLLGYLAMTSRTVGEAVERSVRYHRIIKEGTDSQLVSAGPDGSLAVQESFPDPEDVGSIATAECAAASYVVLARRWAAGPVVPREVRFQHERPAHHAHYASIFQCPPHALHFGQKAVAVVFSRETLALPLRTSQPEVASYLEALARKSLSRLPGDDVASAVREAVGGLLREGDVSLSRTARALGLSSRTLQRRLEERGVEYQRLVDDIRCREALRLVGASDTPLSEIGFLLGYSDPKAFRRAFRRWTGVSPAELRRGRDGAFGGRAAEVWSS